MPGEKQATLNRAIEACDPLESLRVPLGPCGGSVARPLVSVGQRVSAGDRIAEAAAGGVDIFAPLDGVVRAITSAAVADGRDLFTVPAIELADLSTPAGVPEAEETFAWQEAEAATLQSRLAQGQLSVHHLRNESLVRWISHLHTTGCRHLILNGMEHEPFVTASHRLLVEHGQEVVAGLALLARAAEIHNDNVLLAVDAERADAYGLLDSPLSDYAITRIALPRVYPIGADPILAKVLIRKEVPYGGSLHDIQAAVIDPATCFAAYRWVACSQRLLGRVVTVAGDAQLSPSNRFVPFGAAAAALANTPEATVLLGGPMTGLPSREDAVIGPTTDAVVSLTTRPHVASAQCIRCGWCRDHCPVGLHVSMLNDRYELAQLARAGRDGAMSCLACGVCSYVCPAQLPLTDRVSQLARQVADSKGLQAQCRPFALPQESQEEKA